MRGFTLIELIIVLFIMGTLAVIVIGMVTSTTEEAKLNTLKSNLAIMRRATVVLRTAQ
jgi:prepilin-type N-terminal cleavage/methylation domain-containing protein